MTEQTPTPAPLSRIVIEDLAPAIDQARLPVKRVVGEPVEVEAAVYAEGHDRLWCVLVACDPDDATTTVPMVATEPGLDLWGARFVPQRPGLHQYLSLIHI